MSNNRLLVPAAVAGIVLFLLTLFELFQARVATGDVYPVYSSLRTDAAGTKAYYESIGQIRGLNVERRFDPLSDYQDSNTTFLLFGVPPVTLVSSGQALSTYEACARRGNRLVITFPVCSTALAEEEALKQRAASFRWKLAWNCVKRADDGMSKPTGTDHYIFTRSVDPWRTIAVSSTGATIAIERQEGKGSLVVVADGYAFTNEALLRARRIDLLTDVLGANRQIAFDEDHLGVSETEGIVSLALKYRLHGFGAGLLLLGLLFLWRNTYSFLPPVEERNEIDEVAGRSAASGLTNLLARTIPSAELVSACAAVWARSSRGRSNEEDAALVTLIASSPEASTAPIESYRRIAEFMIGRRRR